MSVWHRCAWANYLSSGLPAYRRRHMVCGWCWKVWISVKYTYCNGPVWFLEVVKRTICEAALRAFFHREFTLLLPLHKLRLFRNNLIAFIYQILKTQQKTTLATPQITTTREYRTFIIEVYMRRLWCHSREIVQTAHWHARIQCAWLQSCTSKEYTYTLL